MTDPAGLATRVALLVEALKLAKEAAEAIPVQDSGGTSNWDEPTVTLPKWRTADVEAAAALAGLRCRKYSSRQRRGQWAFAGWDDAGGNNRTRKAEAFEKAMSEQGFQASVYYVMD